MISQKEFDDAMADLVKAEAEIDELRKIRDGCEKIMLGRKAEIERLRMLIVRWLNGGDPTLAQDSRDAINPR
jgi:hypothetical protein